MRVLQLGKYYPPFRGGIENHVETLAWSLAELGVAVNVLVVNHALGEDTQSSGLSRTRTRRERQEGRVRVVRAGRVANLAHLNVCPRLPFLLREELREADLVHLHAANPTMSLALASARLRVPLIVTHHSDVGRQRLLRHALRPLEDLHYRRAARILATSPALAERSSVLARWREKVTPLPLGIEAAPFVEPRPEVAREAARLRERYPGARWLMVGRLTYYKGHEVALEALREVEGTLLVIGTGPLAGQLWERAQALGVEERVVFMGEVGDELLCAAYQAATALWFPSLSPSEAFGLAQVEAMLSGCPVINADVPNSGVAWVCPHDEGGLTVPIRDAPALARAAQQLVSSPELRERLAAGARARALERFTRQRMAKDLLRVYEQTLEGHP